MSYVNLTLRFADAAQARRELAEYLQDGAFPDYGAGVFFDVIGVVYRPTGAVELDDGGYEVPVFGPLPGWFLNIRVAQGEAEAIAAQLAPWQVEQAVAREWALG
ncbi:hypothetical protein LPB142_08285 [Rhodobacter xanthinilyticus]|uniref:Uncharacterized protein n=1 Tax=Rhodobacter xanthinilyticus TaxID=1850250 RepID=A0A1D9MBY1_9RHOB|nr:hypothetical protein [Rhodobacter xanthinilyticus]AOZ69313.1 hypothetical protein LPB142_08285 [Rhodobacter xanthinilyticus]